VVAAQRPLVSLDGGQVVESAGRTGAVQRPFAALLPDALFDQSLTGREILIDIAPLARAAIAGVDARRIGCRRGGDPTASAIVVAHRRTRNPPTALVI